MAERFSDRMNQSDTTMWRIERDPSLRTTIVGLSLLSEAPDWARLRERIEAVSHEIPRLRQRVVEPPLGVGPPRWVEDPGFDLDYHLRRVVAPGPGDVRAVLDLAAPIAMAAFDRDRPLWEFTLVEGLADGRAALIQKVHHSVTDGVGAIRMARLVFDEHEVSADHHRFATKGPKPDPFQVLLDNATEQARDTLRLAEKAAVTMPAAMVHTLQHPGRTATGLLKTAESVVKLVRPAKQPLSPLMRGRSMSRRLAGMEFSLTGLKAAAHAADGTLNDAFLAALAGGLRRYHDLHGTPADAVRVTMPINLRRRDDAIGNNRFVPVRFALPIGEPDPRRRMKELGEIARGWRKEPGLKFTDAIAGALNLMPAEMTAAVMGGMLKAVDMVATNVPGLETPCHLAGATLEAQYAFAPPSGAAISAGLLSYIDHCTLGLVMDTAAVPDPELFTACLAEGFVEVLAVGAEPPKRKAKKSARA